MVTEASRGIGVHIARALVKQGVNVSLAARSEAELGPVDILINHAGIETASHFETADVDELVRTLDVNLISARLLTRSVLPGMLERGRGHVVNIASGAGKVGVPYAVAYAASNHGLVGFSNSLRCEFHKSPVGIVGRASPTKVADVVVSCIRNDRSEVLVNTPPVRPLVVLANIAPRLTPRLMKMLGYTRMFRRVADRQGNS